MRITRTFLVTVIGFSVTVLPVDAVNRSVKPADYSAIETRNPFGLVERPKPQAIVPVVEPVKVEPPPNVELTGMFHDSVRGKTYALFSVLAKGETKKRSYMLSEGESQDGLKVESIDRKATNVKINLKGLQSTITYNKPKAPAVAKRQVPRRSGARPKTKSGANRYGRQTSANVRNLQPMQRPSAQQYRTAGRPGTLSGSGGSRNVVAGGLPSRQLRTSRAMTPGEQVVAIEVQREVNKLRQLENPGSVPIMPPLPPTPLTTPEDLRRIVVQPRQPGQ